MELLMAVEDRLGVAIPDAEAAALVTVGELHQLLMAKLHALTGEVCLTSRVFYRLRRALMLTFDLPRERILLDTPLESLLPPRGRRKHWRRLGTALGLQVPELELPRPLFRAIIAAGILAAVGAEVAGMLIAGAVWPALVQGLLMALFAGLLVFLALFALATPFARHIPATCATVRLAVQTLVADNYGALRRETPRPTEDEVWQQLTEVLVAELRITPDKVTPEMRITDLTGD